MLLAELALGLDGRGRPSPHGDFLEGRKNPAQAKLGRGTYFILVGQVLSDPCGLAKS
jgi:hypothetical protein